MTALNTNYEDALATLTASGTDFSTTEAVVNGTTLRVFEKSSMTVRGLYQYSATQFGDQPFLVYEDLRWTFRETYAQVARFAHVLLNQYQIEKGARVAIVNVNLWLVRKGCEKGARGHCHAKLS